VGAAGIKNIAEPAPGDYSVGGVNLSPIPGRIVADGAFRFRRPWEHGGFRARILAAAAAAMLLLASGCGSVSAPDAGPRVQVVDGAGTPIPGAVIFPDYEYSSSQRTYTKEVLDELASDAQGFIHADLDDFLWDKDGCYHFVIRRAGYDAATMSVSKDLAPPVLRVVMALNASPAAPGGR
jgi:hypothetical protein